MVKEIKITNDWSAWTLIENIAEKSELDVLVEDDNVVSEVENEEKSRGLRVAIFDDAGEGEGWNWDFEKENRSGSERWQRTKRGGMSKEED